MTELQTVGGLYLPASTAGHDHGYDPGGSLTWLKRLQGMLAYRNARLSIYDNYYSGNHNLTFATPRFKTTFGNLFSEFADNWMPMIVDSPAERLNPVGFRMGKDADKGDEDAWYMWQANEMDSQIKLGITEAILREESYLLTWHDPENPEVASITVEDPSQMIVAYSNENRRKIAAGAKFFADDDGYPCATIYLPNVPGTPAAIYKYRSMTKDYRADDLYQQSMQMLSDRPQGGAGANLVLPSAYSTNPGTPSLYSSENRVWSPRETADGVWPLPNPLGYVPISPVRNKPRLMKQPVSEIHNMIPMQDAVNKFLTDLLLASEFAAFPQRWATGLEIAKGPDGRDLPFATGPGSLLRTKNSEAKMGAFPELTGQAHIKAIELVVQHMASQSRTPPHYFYMSGNFPSGEAIKSAETGLVAKVREKMLIFGESFERAVRIGFDVKGDKRGKVLDSECIWKDPESRTEAEHVDAVIKRIAIGVPLRQLQEDVGYSQAQINRFRQMRFDEIADYMLAQAQSLVLQAQYGIPQQVGTNQGLANTAAGTPPPGPVGKGLSSAAGNLAGTADASATAPGGGTNVPVPGAPVGLPDPTSVGAAAELISSPGSPVATKVKGTTVVA